jgi:OOP family OmpA-OmpF porin
MKNPLIAKLTAYAALCGAATAYAGVTPNLVDASGAPVRDASGACVQTSGINHPDCMPKKVEPPKPAPAPAPKPVEPPKPAPAPAPAPKPAPQPVKAAITIQAEALFDFDKSALKSEGKKSLDDAIAVVNGCSLLYISHLHSDHLCEELLRQCNLSEMRIVIQK